MEQPAPVRVCVRVRPLNARESACAASPVVACADPTTLEVMTPGVGDDAPPTVRAFRFDLCCHDGFSQADFFDHSGVQPLVEFLVAEGRKKPGPRMLRRARKISKRLRAKTPLPIARGNASSSRQTAESGLRAMRP